MLNFVHLIPGEKSLCLIRFTKRSMPLTLKCPSPHHPMTPPPAVLSHCFSSASITYHPHSCSSFLHAGCLWLGSVLFLPCKPTSLPCLQDHSEVLQNLALCWLPSLKTHYFAAFPLPQLRTRASAGRLEPPYVWYQSTISG